MADSVCGSRGLEETGRGSGERLLGDATSF